VVEPVKKGDKLTVLDVIDAYCENLAVITKKNGRRYNRRSISSRREDLLRFAAVCGVTHVEDLTRDHLNRYKESLYREGKVNDTVLNKLMTITTCLKRNPLLSIPCLLKSEDWPIKKRTTPRPFTEAEQEALMAATTTFMERLLFRTFLQTGMRHAEVAHLERDVNEHDHAKETTTPMLLSHTKNVAFAHYRSRTAES
jgi:site-specific recombinase XerD